MQARCLSIVLNEDVDFMNLIRKVERALDTDFRSVDKKGRYIAEGEFRGCKVSIVDRVDRLGEMMSDQGRAGSNFTPCLIK